jgi:hypothetical protein
MMHKVIFSDMVTDADYTATEDHCSGHAATVSLDVTDHVGCLLMGYVVQGTKAWLAGFFFSDATISAQDLTNEDINTILNPTSDDYRNLVNFVYDVSGWNVCL